jgi:hypothetical protein
VSVDFLNTAHNTSLEGFCLELGTTLLDLLVNFGSEEDMILVEIRSHGYFRELIFGMPLKRRSLQMKKNS